MNLFLVCCLFLSSALGDGSTPSQTALYNSMDRRLLNALETLEPDFSDSELEEALQLYRREQVLCDPAWIQRNPQTDTSALQSAWKNLERIRKESALIQISRQEQDRIRARIEEREEKLESYAARDTEARIREGKADPGAMIAGTEDLPQTGGPVMEDRFTDIACPAYQSDLLVPSGTFINPIPSARISAGTWSYPGGGLHLGLDLAAGMYTEILAPASGLVVYQSSENPSDSGYPGNFSGYPAGAGNSILLLCPFQDRVFAVSFAHLSDRHFVRSGQTVRQGDRIALSGNAGNSTGPHTHIEIIELRTDLETAVRWFSDTADFTFGTGWSVPAACTETACRRRPEELLPTD